MDSPDPVATGSRPWFPIIVTVIYIGVACITILSDRRGSSGGWINLNGLATFIVTFPVSLIGEWIGAKPDHRRNADMIVTVSLCAALVFGLATGLARFVKALFTGDSGP